MLLSALAVISATVASGPLEPASFEREVTVTASADYLISFPDDYTRDGDPSPLLLFLHGAGERGTDLNQVKIWGPPRLINEGKALPFIVVAPQCPPRQWWDVATLVALLDEIEAEHNVDPDRIVVTGLSMGGFGSWALAAEQPDRFAAIAPVCGGYMGDLEDLDELNDLPIWATHGDMDDVVKPEETTRIIEHLRSLGGEPNMIIFPGVNHNAWEPTYNDPKFWEWIEAQTKADD